MYNWDADFLGKTGQVSPIFGRPLLEHATVCPLGAKMQSYLSHEEIRVSEGGIAINWMFNLKLKQLYFKTKVYLENSPRSLKAYLFGWKQREATLQQEPALPNVETLVPHLGGLATVGGAQVLTSWREVII